MGNNTITADPIPVTDEQRWNLIQNKANEARALRAVSLLRRHGIEPVVIKGVAAARFYPADILRDCVDVDLAVAETDYPAAMNIAQSAAADGYAIDLHCELRHLDTVAWDDLIANSREFEVNGGSVRVLAPEDHLRVLCVHWLTDGGTNKDRLWDIYYAVDNRPADFSWERFLGPVSERRSRWYVCTVGLAHHFLGLNLEGTPIEDSARNLPNWLVTTVKREWASDTKNWPLEASLSDPSALWKQVKRRLRPNPIWATVHMEGDFDARSRLFYQAANIFARIPSSYRRIASVLRQKKDEQS